MFLPAAFDKSDEASDEGRGPRTPGSKFMMEGVRCELSMGCESSLIGARAGG